MADESIIIFIKEQAFVPSRTTISQYTTVTFFNEDIQIHHLHCSNNSNNNTNNGNSNNKQIKAMFQDLHVKSNSRATYKFDRPGKYTISCKSTSSLNVSTAKFLQIFIIVYCYWSFLLLLLLQNYL